MTSGRPQAKDVPEQVILDLLRREPGRWWTHRDGHGFMPSLIQEAPELAKFPEKVLRAKLSSMMRRKLIDGCDCGCRGDWHVETSSDG